LRNAASGIRTRDLLAREAHPYQTVLAALRDGIERVFNVLVASGATGRVVRCVVKFFSRKVTQQDAKSRVDRRRTPRAQEGILSDLSRQVSQDRPQASFQHARVQERVHASAVRQQRGNPQEEDPTFERRASSPSRQPIQIVDCVQVPHRSRVSQSNVAKKQGESTKGQG